MGRKFVVALILTLLGSPAWAQSGRFVIGGEFFYRKVFEHSPFHVYSEMRTELGHEFHELVMPYKAHGQGNFGVAYVGYEYRQYDTVYGALRARWANGSVHRRKRGDEVVVNRVIDRGFLWSNRAHEWNVEGRVGYTVCLGGQDEMGLSPYSGVGYEAGHMTLVGRQYYSWWYIPVGFVASYDWQNGFMLCVDADFGMMAGSRYIRLDEPTVNNIEREFGNRYRWELEMPVSFTGCDWAVAIVPFWRAWRVRDNLQGIRETRFDSAVDGFVIAPTETELFRDMRVKFDQPVVSPAILSNSYGGRLEFSWYF
jgi:hypothetical protein